MKKKILLIVLPVLLLTGGGVAYFLMRSAPAKSEGEAGAHAEAETKSEPPGMVPMESFLANINDNGKDRYAKLNLKLTIAPGSLAEHVAHDEVLQAKLRDRVLTLLTSKTYDDLVSPMGKEGFRRELKAHLTPLVEGGEIQDVLFSEFVVQ